MLNLRGAGRSRNERRHHRAAHGQHTTFVDSNRTTWACSGRVIIGAARTEETGSPGFTGDINCEFGDLEEFYCSCPVGTSVTSR